MANIKFSAFTQKVVTGNVDFLVGYTGADNVRISPAIFSDTYLPLVGGTMTGVLGVVAPDNFKWNFGTGSDSELYHTGVHFFLDNSVGTSYIRNTATGGSGILLRNSVIGDIQFDNEFAGNILFNTSNVERMRIDSLGNVGIATSVPGARLDVNGSLYARNVIYGYAGAGNQYGGLSWGGADEGFLFLKDSNVTKVNIDSNGDSYFNGGNVGIGTDSPASILHLASAAATVFRVEETTNNATAAIYATASDLWMGSITNHPLKILTNDVPAITIDTSQNATFGGKLEISYANPVLDLQQSGTTAFRMEIDGGNDTYMTSYGAGNFIALRTDSTTALTLDGNQDAIFAGNIILTNNTGELQWKDAGGTAARMLTMDNGDTLILGNPTTVDDIRFDVDTYGEGAMMILSSGNVGIGTVTPQTNAGYSKVLQIHGTLGTVLKLTDDTSGSGVSDGFEMLQYGDASYLINRENGIMAFSTNNVERMRITNTGLTKINSSTSGNHEASQKTGTYTKTSTGSTTAMTIVKVGHSHAVNYTVTAKIDTSNVGVLVGNTATAYGSNGGIIVDSEAYSGVISDIAVTYDNSYYGLNVAVTYTGASHPIIYMAVTGQSSEDFVQQ